MKKLLKKLKTLAVAGITTAVAALGAMPAHAADKRIIVTGENSSADKPYVLTEGKTYTAEPFDRDPPKSWCNIGGAAVAVTNIMSGAVVTKPAYLVGTNITFSGNQTTTLSGGALYTKGWVTLSNTIFTNNTAAAQGGAFFAWTGGVTLDNGATFIGNKHNNASGCGGAVLSWQAAVKMNGNILFKNNAAVGIGGAIANQWFSELTINGDATFVNNTSAKKGGAIDNAGSKLSFTGTIDLQTDTDTWINRVNHSAPATVNWDLTQVTDPAQSKVCIKGFQRFGNELKDGVVQSSQTLTVKADGEQPAGRYVIATGDFSLETMAATNVTEFIVTNGIASVTIEPDGDTGMIGLQGYKLAVEESEAAGGDELVLSVINYTCKRKELLPGASTNLVAGVYSAAPTDKAGGVFRVYPNATLTGTDVNFVNNEVSGSSQGYGGAIYTSGTTAFTNATFRNNKAEMFGGAIDYHGEEKNGAKAILANVTFADNTAQKGGALSCQGDNLSIDKATFTGNTTTLNGGAIIIMDNHKNVAIANASFSQNTSGRHGGAIEIGTNAELTLSGDESGTSFEGNSAVNGGALYFEGGSKSVTFEDAVTFTGNTATEKGGAIYSCGMINMANTVTLETETDTIYNAEKGTLNWDLADGKAGCLNGYDKLENDGALQLTIDDAIAAPTNIVIATGNFSNIEGKDTFTITNALGGAAYGTATIDGSIVGPTGGTVGYKLVTEAAGATTNLVLQVLKVSPRVVVDASNSPYTIMNCTYTTVPTTENGGAAWVELGGALIVTNTTFKDNWTSGSFGALANTGEMTLKDVTFSGNDDKEGNGAVYNGYRLNLDGFVTLETATDKLYNESGTLNWNLAGGNAGVLNGYEKLNNASGTLQITVENYAEEAAEFVIATGDFSNIDDKKTFVITNGVAGGAAATVEIDGEAVIANFTMYQLTTEEDLGATPPTTNLVLTAIKPDMSTVIVNSNWEGKYKLGEEIEIEGETYYYGLTAFAEVPSAPNALSTTEELIIAGGSASITNEVTLKAPAKLVIDNGAALSIMGEGSITNSLAAKDSISGNGAIYLDKGITDDQLKNYTEKLAAGSALTIARASVTDSEAKTLVTESFYDIDAHDKSASGEKTDTVITANLTADGIDAAKGLALRVTHAENLTAAGSITATAGAAKPQTLKLVREEAATGDLTVNGKVSGFDSIKVENKNESGKMVTTSTLAANYDIMISNDGHLEAKVMAGARLEINNTSANTIIGEYSGQRVAITNTAEGVAQDITLQAYAGNINLYGTPGSVFSNVVLVAGINATPADLSANDGTKMLWIFDTNTLSGTVLAKAGMISGGTGSPLLRLENADATFLVGQVAVNTEIYGECNIASNDNGTVKFGAKSLTLKDGAVLGGKTRIVSSCVDENFILEGTVTLKDGAEVDRRDDKVFTVPDGATLKLQGSKIRGQQLAISGTLDVEDGLNDVNKIGSAGTINLKGGELIVDGYLSNSGVLNWDLTAGTTTLDWSKVSGSGAWVATVGDVASGTSYTLATNAAAATVTQTFTVTNSVAGGAAATVKAGGVCKVGGKYWALNVKNGQLTLSTLDPVKLTDVFIIDEETGKTNATAVVKFGDQTIEPEADGSFEVPANYPLNVIYEAADDYMFGPGLKNKTVTLPNGISGDGPMPAEYKELAEASCQAQWVEGDGEAGGREIALDTRERIVVASPNDVLPIAYSTNYWGTVDSGSKVSVLAIDPNGQITDVVEESAESGYGEYMPKLGDFGQYVLRQSWFDSVGEYIATTNATVWYGQDYQFAFDEDQMIYVERPGDEHGLGNLEDVTSYTLLNLKATPEYTNVDRYEFVTWKAYSYSQRDEGWKTPEECPQLAAQFGDIYAAETTFEMPFTNVFLTCSYQWKSNYNEVVTVKPGVNNAWEIHEGEVYKAGIATTNGSIVSFRESISSCFPDADKSLLKLAAGATNIWDFTDNGRPCLVFFSRIVAEEGAVNMVLFDETLTNDTYRIATHAETSVGQSFLISNGSSEKECTVVAQAALETADWTYVGAKRFKLYAMPNNLLMLLVETGILQNVVIADDFSANPPFEDYDPLMGTFTWNGQVWTNGVNAFTSFTDLFTNELYSVGATNISVFGTQTIATEPTTDLPWTLNLIAYKDAKGNDVTPVVTVGKDLDTDELINITNSLSVITGSGAIVLGKSDADKSIYNPYFDDPKNFAVSNVGVEPKKDEFGNVTADVNRDAKPAAGTQTIVLQGVENQDGDVTIAVGAEVTSDTVVAGKVEAPNGTVTIVHRAEEQSLAVAGGVSAKNVVIDNYGHFDADVTAADGIVITNRSVNTLVGDYTGKTISLEGVDYASMSNATFTATETITLTGKHGIYGPVAFTAPTVVNQSCLAWSVKGMNHETYLEDFNVVSGGENFAVMADMDQDIAEHLDVAPVKYLLAGNAKAATGLTFQLVQDFGEAYPKHTAVVVGGEMVYPEDARGYRLSVNEDEQLVLTVDWGVSPQLRAELINTVKTNAAASIQALYDLETLSENEIAERKAAIEKQRDATLEFLADVKVPAKAREAVEKSIEFNEDILKNAEWTAEARARFGETEVFAAFGVGNDVYVYGGSMTKPTQETVTLQKNTLTSYKAYYNGKKVSFPLVLNWDAGDREPKVITIVPAKGCGCSAADVRFLTLQLGSEAAQETVAPQVCTITVGDPEENDTLYVRALPWPANGGKVSGYGVIKTDKYGAVKTARTLKAKANRWAKFAGWYAAKADNPNEIDTNACITTATSLKVGKGTDYTNGTFYAYFTDVMPLPAVNQPDATAKGATGVIGDGSTYTGTVGINFTLPISSDDEDATITVSGLPSGLKYNKTTGCIEGVPTKATAGKTVKIVAKNAAGKHTATFTFVINALPEEYIGTFVGDLFDASTNEVGEVQIKVNKTGSTSVRVKYGKKNYGFSQKGFDLEADNRTVEMTIEKKNTGMFYMHSTIDEETDALYYEGTVVGDKFEDGLFFKAENLD